MTIEQMFFSIISMQLVIFGLMITQFIFFMNKFEKIDTTLAKLNETMIRLDNRISNLERDTDIDKKIQAKIDFASVRR